MRVIFLFLKGKRPVSLIGFSLGARVIYYCLQELANDQGSVVILSPIYRLILPCIEMNINAVIASTLSIALSSGSEGVVEDVVLLGAPVDGSKKAWEKMTRVVAGKIVNGYCRWTEYCFAKKKQTKKNTFKLVVFRLFRCLVPLFSMEFYYCMCISTYQRRLASGILVQKFSCTTLCCWATASRHPGSPYNQCGSIIRGESDLIFKLDLRKRPKLVICYVHMVQPKMFLLCFFFCLFPAYFQILSAFSVRAVEITSICLFWFVLHPCGIFTFVNYFQTAQSVYYLCRHRHC